MKSWSIFCPAPCLLDGVVGKLSTPKSFGCQTKLINSCNDVFAVRQLLKHRASAEQCSYGLGKPPFRNPRVEIRGFSRISAHSAGWRNCGLFRGIVPRTRSAYSAGMVPTAETPHAHAHACCLRIFPQDIVGETSSRTIKVIYMPFCTSLLCICACAV